MRNFQKLFGVKIPVVQAPMAGVQGSDLVIAVSNAGGIGSLPCGMLDPTKLVQELEKIKSKTDQPFNVNFFCHSEPKYNQEKEQAWKLALLPYYKEYNIEPHANIEASGTERKPFNLEMAEILEKYQPPIISFHFGLPSDKLLAPIKKWGAKIISTATTVEEAIWLERKGVDVIIAQGLEAGGHRGHFLSNDLIKQMGTFALLPQIVKAVNCPVIAAGGIADKRGVHAALQLGAVGVQVGTAYLLCPEVFTKDIHRIAIKTVAKSTAVTNLFSGRPARGIMNRLMQELGPMNNTVPPFPLASSFIISLRQFAEGKGCGDFSPLWCGQNRDGCKEIPAAKLTKSLYEDLGYVENTD